MALSPFQRAALKEQEEKKQKTTTTKSSTPSPFERAAQKEQASGIGYQRPAVIGSALDVQRRYQDSQKPRDYLSEARRANEKIIDTGNSMTDDERAKRRTELNSRMQELEKDRSRYNSALAAGLASGRLENEIRSRVKDIDAQLIELQNELRDVERGRYISEREQLTNALSERQEATRNAREVMHEYTGGMDDYELSSAIAKDPGTWSRIYEAVRDARDDEYRAQRQIDQLDYLNKYMDRSYTEDAQADSFGDKWNNFWQQSRANYDVGRIGQDVNQAYTDYLNSGRYEDRNYAQALAQLDADFQRRNAAVLDNENQVLPWISQSAANYVPQFIDQTKAQLGGGAIGAAAGLFVGNPIAGAKAGAVAGSGKYSYDQMRGAAYRTMIEAGIDDATARAAANDEALISALIEMGDTALDMMLLGGNKALDAIGKPAGLGKSSAAKAVAGALGNRATKKAAKEAVKLAAKPTTMKVIGNVAGRIALGAASEAFEEGTQEAVSIANEKRGGTGGKLNLVKGALNVLFQSMTGQDSESAARIKEAAGEGAKISLMFGTGTLATNTAITKAANHAEMVSLGKEYRSRESQVIESALKQNEDTTAYQMAEELKGQEKISDAELGRMVYANQLAETEKLISTYKDDTEALKALISEGKESGKGTVSYKVAQRIENKLNSNKEITTGDVEQLIAANQVYINAEETAQAANAEQTRTRFGYGRNGEKAFESLLENSNMTVDEARSRFQSAYEAGRTNLPTEMASLTDKVQIAAFHAGLQDYNLDARKTFSATLHGTESGLVENELSKSIPQSKAALVNEVSKALGIKTVMQERIVAGTGEANASMSSNGILRLSSRSDKPIIVAVAHEGTHRMQQLAPREYTDFRNFAVQQMEKGRPDSAGTLVEAVQARAAEQNVYLSTEGAMDEIAAEYAENLFGDEEKLRTALNEAVGDAKTRKSMNKFFEIVHNLIQKLKKLLPKYRGDERKQLQSDIDAMQNGEQLWKDMLAASIKAVDDRAPAMTEAVELSDVNTQFSIREKDPPKKIGIAYKVFMAKDGQLYPPMVANPGGEGTPVGVWLDADVGKAAPPSKTGRPQVQGGGKGTNSGKISLAFRPGWHLGDVPLATQFARKNPETGKKDLFPANFVWAECEYAMDVDYQEEAMSYGYTDNGKFRHSYAGLPKLPTDGYYRYRTNPNPDTVPWIITGAMRVKRILTDAETDAICRENGVEPMKREGGPIDLEKYGIKAGEQYSLKDTVTNKAGDIVAEFHPNGSAQFSLKTYSEDGRTNLKKWLDKRVASNAISKADADDIVRQLDEFYDICQKFVGKYAPFGAWSNAEVVRDAKGKPVFSVVKANGEYSMNLDFSLVCKKRRTLDAVFKELINRGSLDQMEMGEEQIASINQIIRESGFETACALCFVDSKRYRQANVADNFVNQYNELVNMLVPDGSNIKAHHFDFMDRGANDEGRALHTVPNSELGKGIVKLKKVMQENGKLTVAHKIASHLLNNPQDRKLVMRSEFMNTDGFEAVTLKNRKVLGLYNSSKGRGGPKASLSDVQYLGDILKKNNFTPARAYAVGGVRIQSFSDYIPRLVFDYLQMTADLAAKKLPAHAYTKEEMFAKQFGMTGIKINMSLVPAVVKDGVAPGLDANGDYVWYDGQSFGSDVNVKGSGQTGFKTAVEIQNASGYSSNCGTIAVGISDEHIWKMLDDSDIRMVIPYHKSSLNHIVAVMNNIDQYKDYTGVQNTRDAKTGSKITGKDFNYNEALRRLGDAKAAANEYLEWCDDNRYLPKFDTFSGHENYYKLLEDFSTYDNGEAAPQGPVTMTFPKSGDAFGSMAQLIEDGLDEDAVLEARREKSVPGIVDKIEGVLKSRGTPDDEQFSLKGQNDLLKQNARLKEVNETLREQMKLTTFAKVDKKSLDNFTKKLLKDYQSGAEINDVRAMLEGLYNYMANGEGETKTPVWNVVQKVAYDTAVQILENVSVRNDELYQAYSELRHTVRTTGITLDQQDRADVSAGYDTFRKNNLGKIKLVNNGIPVDTFYQELAGRYPEFFDEAEHSHPADQLEHIAEVLDSLNPFEENPYSLNMRESATWLANDIIERFFELPQAKPTFADKAKAKQDRTRAQGAQRLERVREQKNERIAKIIADNREKLNETRQKERAKRNEAVKQVKEHYKAKEAKMSESRKARVLRDKIIRHAGELSRKLISPTDKQHIPQQLQGAVAELLASINLESNYTYDPESQSYKKSDDGLPTRRTRAFAELRTLYTQMANELTIDPDLMGDDGLLSDVANLADKRIVDMTTSELETIWQTMRAVEATIRTANRALSKSRWATISEFADVLRESNKNKKPPAEYRGVIGTLQNIAVLEMETPETYFHMLGEGGDAIFRMMRNAQDDHIRMMKEVADFTNSALKGVDVRKLESKMHTVTLGGEKVTLSTAQLMELYVLMRREQARDHIFVGGILPDVLDTKGIRKVTKAKPVRGITLEEVSKAVSRLTDSQKKTAEKLQEFSSTKLSEYGNKASMQVYGYEKFGEKTYWPIRVNRQEVRSDIQNDSAIVAMVNKGFTKGTKPHANNSVRLGSIFDTFASHATDMASYSAWLGVTEDVNRIRNYTFRNDAGRAVDTVKAIIESVHGSRGGNYLAKLLGDVANGVKSTHGETDYMSGWIGNFKAAAVGANLRVMIQQPTAILRAMDMIGAQYMAVPGNPMSGWKKAMKYAPIAQWKDWGYFDINTGRQMKDVLFNTDSGLDKVRNFSMAGAGFMDSVSWGHLWNAVEAETKAKRKGLKAGSEELYKAVAERFTEIVDHTQVVDGILQRSQMMRTADTGKKMATAFMAEPTKQYNMMMQALYDMTKADKKHRSAAARGFRRTAVALAVAGVVNAAAQSIMDAMRDDDKEKKYWEKWFEAFIGKTDEGIDIIGSNVGDAFNPISYIPFVKDVGSLVAGYDVERTDMAVFKDIIDAGRALMKALDSEGKQSKPGAIINFVSVLSGAFGLSASNLKREIHSFTTTYAIQTDNYLMQYRMDKFWLSLNTSANTKRFVDILYNAYKNDQDAYKIIYADMVDSGFDVEKIQKGMDDRLKADQGVNSVDELTQRFLPPDKQPEYDKSIRKIQSNTLWKSANAGQKKDLENRLYDLVTGNKSGAGMEEDISDGAKYGIDDTDYLLYKMAMEMFDTPNEKGKYGTYTNAEKAEAITSMSDLTDAEMAWMWGNTTTSDEVWDAYNAGVDMEDYMAFKGAIDDIHADKNANGKTIKDSRKRKVIEMLNGMDLTDDEWNFLYHLEYK